MRVRSRGHAFVHLRAVVGNRFSSPPIWVKEPNSRHQASKSLYPLSYRPTPEHPDSLSVGVFTVVGYSVHLPLPPPVLSSVSSPAALCVVQFSFTVIRHLRELKGVRTYSAHGARGFHCSWAGGKAKRSVWGAVESLSLSSLQPGMGRERARDKRLKGTFLVALFRFHLSVAIPEEPTSGLIVGALMI